MFRSKNHTTQTDHTSQLCFTRSEYINLIKHFDCENQCHGCHNIPHSPHKVIHSAP